ncbi:NAD(P)-dependent alcohol dehydrogenase [Spirochaeta africana]|uniref:Theronine dehydrogenase-like Zn-dependent dehydrogenase n=1 Tax=Spirochaeta africana (strain ATCC 700263 / DSM 8902 / Z-7692) TaxID=889378 RepID=H9UG77_SPIAZ|nr:NAD(P)-dependent alcohol dehydrogenase [Spirochaeta africana]AFG36520.1 theronine dehydrogenase-like Zn-dependent dehydrogenase [Spirochaeta africana DSM 8902]
MEALVLEKVNQIAIRDIVIDETLGPRDVRVKPVCIGICGSDVHYYLHGRIGDFVVKEPMVLGHEASGIVTEIGAEVTDLKVGDRVCMEPGIPDHNSEEYKLGIYNLDPAVRFWATPPIHGCMRESVVHPAQFTFRLPDNVSFAEGALVEPVAIGVQAAKKAQIQPGDSALVLGAGTIGIVTAMAAAASGCSNVYITDISAEKLDLVRERFGDRFTTVAHAQVGELHDAVDIVFEASGAAAAVLAMARYARPGGRIVLIGMTQDPVPVDIVGIEVKELTMYSIFRYAHVFDRTLQFISSGKIDVQPLVTHTYPFSESVAAYDFAASMPSDAIKVMIEKE